MCFYSVSPSSLIIHINVSLCDTIYCTTSLYLVHWRWMMVHPKHVWLNNMNFKNIVWFIKAISYFVLLRSLGNMYNNIIIVSWSITMMKTLLKTLSGAHLLEAFGEVLELMLQLNWSTLFCSNYNWTWDYNSKQNRIR